MVPHIQIQGPLIMSSFVDQGPYDLSQEQKKYSTSGRTSFVKLVQLKQKRVSDFYFKYIETIIGSGSELHCTHDDGTGKHGSPPSCAQSASG